MLTRILLIIAILAGLGATGLGLVKVKESIIALTENRDNEKKMKEEQTARAVKAEKNYAAEKTKFEKEKTEHDGTKNQLSEANASLADAKSKNQQLAADLDKVKAERTKAQQDLAAWEATGSTPDKIKAMIEDVKNLSKTVAGLQDENKVITKKKNQLQAQLDELLKPVEDGERLVPLPPGLKGKVVAVDPRWDFVVLDIGDNHGAREGGVMLVSRDSKLVGKIRIRTVQADRCIANVVKGWKLSDIVEGDVVLY